MPGCAALYCSNHSRNGFQLYRFPACPERRQKWLINCKRDKWNPTQNARLCSAHFEPTQFETKRADGKIKLSPFAIPTIFKTQEIPKLPDKNVHEIS